MLHGRYSMAGPDQRLRGEGALLRQDAADPDCWLAQFDNMEILPEAFGWHVFPKDLFVELRGEPE